MADQTLRALATAYNAAPSGWLRSYGRIDNRVRAEIRRGAQEAAALLPEDAPFDARDAITRMAHVGSGVDPRGGAERDQMLAAMDNVAATLARLVAR